MSKTLCNVPPLPLLRISIVFFLIWFVFVFKGTQITQVPILMRQPLDLFKFFTVVRERGGLQEVSLIKQLLIEEN